MLTLFRERVCETLGVAPFLHQRQVWAASDGVELTGEESDQAHGVSVRVDQSTVAYVATRPRPQGRARFLSDLGAFKIGKSYGAAIWATGFAAVPDAKVSLVGLEYDICSPEFTYICDALLGESGMNLKFDTYTNRPRQGDMFLRLKNGATYECRSWERKDSLKGKENDLYLFCESYQLPGIECFTGVSQNLRARRGYAYFATTPDKPWIKLLHELGHGADPEWACICSVPAEANPYTFDATAKKRDATLMTKEKFEIHYNGQLGDFVGRVFAYARGQRIFDDQTHPHLFRKGEGPLRERLQIPGGWDIVCGADTGTYYSALVVAFDPNGIAYVLDEFPNYRYVGGSPERDETLTIPHWAMIVGARVEQLGGRACFWADPNSQFKTELRNYGMTLLSAKAPVETRTEIAREYFEHHRILIAPWVTTLPFELENASWPEEATASGKFSRVKDRDHTLDPLEHIVARRPFGRVLGQKQKQSWAASLGLKRAMGTLNVHLGRN